VRRLLVGAAMAVALITIVISVSARLGYTNPLVVISGSMEPEISTGDLLIDVRVPVSELQVGDVVSARPDADHLPVSHRIVEVQPHGDTVFLRLKGDANASVDAPVYQLSGTAWVPRWRIPGVGWVLAKAVKPSVMYPLAVAIVALIVYVLVPGPRGIFAGGRAAGPARHRAEGGRHGDGQTGGPARHDAGATLTRSAARAGTEAVTTRPTALIPQENAG